MIFIKLLLLCILKSTLEQDVSILNEDKLNAVKNLKNKLSRLLEVSNSQQKIDGILIIDMMNNTKKDCIFKELQYPTTATLLNFDEKFLQATQNLEQYSKESLILICTDDLSTMLDIFHTKTYDHVHNLRHFIHMPYHNQAETTELCRQAFKYDVYNLLLIFEQLNESNSIIFKCRKFPPHPQLFEEFSLHQNITARLFENQFLDMHGAKIETLADQGEPRNMLHMDKAGNLRVLGYYGKLVETFIERRNATFSILMPMEFGVYMFEEEVLKHMDASKIDIAISISSSLGMFEKIDFSYPYELGAYCFMIPIPTRMLASQIFFHIIDTPILLSVMLFIVIYGALLVLASKRNFKQVDFRHIFINDKSLRGMLGQSFPLRHITNFNARFICCQLCAASILINTMYQAFLSASLTEPPLLPWVHDAADAASAGLKILITEYDKSIMENFSVPAFFTHKKIFTIMNMDEVYRIRSTMDTRYIYPMGNAHWLVFKEQQSYFKHKLFYFSDDFCIVKFAFLALPIRRRLPYRALFDDFILRAHSGGFYQLWKTQVYHDLLIINKIERIDFSATRVLAEEVKIDDLFLIGSIYLGCIFACIVIFFAELYTGKVLRKLK